MVQFSTALGTLANHPILAGVLQVREIRIARYALDCASVATQSSEMDEDDARSPNQTGEVLRQLSGGTDLLEWFDGRVPSFHDAEVLGITLNREDEAGTLRIHTFEMTPEIDDRGYFVLRKHVVVSFQLSGITSLELTDFNHQNVVYGLSLARTETGGFRLELEPCYGLFGFIEAQIVAISIEPGMPASCCWAQEPP